MSLLHDLRHSTQTLLKHPGFVITITLILALGIGANSAIFSVVSAVLLRPLPYEDPDRIVMIWETNLNKGLDRSIVSPANYLDWRDRNHVFEQIAAWRFWFYNLAGTSEPERIHGVRVSASFFPLLGVKPALGRNFLPEEEQVGHDRVVVLSYGLWQRPSPSLASCHPLSVSFAFSTVTWIYGCPSLSIRHSSSEMIIPSLCMHD